MFNNELWQKPAGGAGGADFYSHQIAKSVRLGDSGYLKRTPSGAGNRATWTFSTWLKLTELATNSNSTSVGAILNAGTSGNQDGFYRLNFNTTKLFSSSAEANFFFSNSLYRDTSGWYHIVWKQGSGTATVYVNGEAASGATASVSGNTAINNNVQHTIGTHANALGETPLKAYLAETIMIDGTALGPDSFGETKNGVWIPKDASGLTYGTNGFRLDYADSSALGNDVSGNNNDWTTVNLSTHDQMLDTPTFNSSSNGGNFATLNPLNTRGSTAVATQLASEGNLKWTPNATQDETSGTMSIGASGVDKVYIEVYCENNSDTGWFGVYDQKDGSLMNAVVQSVASAVRFKPRTGQKVTAGTSSNYIGDGSESNPSGVIFQMAVDVPAGKIWWGRNNAWGSDGANHIDDDNVAFTTLNTDGTYLLFTHTGGASVAQPDWVFNFGQDGTFAGNKTAQGNSDDTGYGNFYYSPPTGFLSLNSGNASVADAVDPAQTDDDYPQLLFGAKTYTGTGSTNALTGLGFQPDFVWIKERGGANNHMLFDSNRGTSKYLSSNTSGNEGTDSATMNTFGSDGFTVGSDGKVNASSDTYVAWNWRANGGGSSNSDGATSSTVQADPSGAFSIVTYTGISGSSGSSTVGHGMGVVPQLIFHKARNATGGWWTQYAFTTNANYFLELNGTRAQTELAAGTYGAMSRPTTSVFSINGVDGVGGESRNYVAYCFANIEGYCKVGKYIGNGNDDGTFVYTGFRPAMMIIKEFGATDNWLIYDNKRVGYNLDSAGNAVLYPDLTQTEENQASRAIDILSNGFKLRTSNATGNASSGDYLYLAMAHNPFKYATAR